MSDPAAPPPTSVLDACAVINLWACGELAAILSATPGPVAMASAVLAETRFDPYGGTGDAPGAERADLTALVAAGVLAVLEPDDAEQETAIALSADLDNGEAFTLAIAIHRGFVVVTDDRTAIRVLNHRAPLRSTLDLVRDWADRDGIARPHLRRVLIDLSVRGRYVPHRGHPLKAWWDAAIAPTP